MLTSNYGDDPSILNSDRLYRRINASFLVPGDDGRMRVASAAFKNYEMSVLIDSLLYRQTRTIKQVMESHPAESVVAITAGLARELKQIVCMDPEPPNDPAHGLVIGKKTRLTANRFAREARWVIPSEPPLSS